MAYVPTQRRLKWARAFMHGARAASHRQGPPRWSSTLVARQKNTAHHTPPPPSSPCCRPHATPLNSRSGVRQTPAFSTALDLSPPPSRPQHCHIRRLPPSQRKEHHGRGQSAAFAQKCRRPPKTKLSTARCYSWLAGDGVGDQLRNMP